MNFDEYERKYEPLYEEFATVVKRILEKSIASADRMPRPQALQSRAKTAYRLKPKLVDRELVDSNRIEQEIRDLAGVRLIFYTNTDVEIFLQSGIIADNFAVDWESTKVHHPTDENSKSRYQAVHYLVKLNKQRSELPEYSAFQGLRCEVQVQTILIHAWAETSHDIVYKSPIKPGFGSRTMMSIERRFQRIMDDYLLPAGYEFQKIQHDFERLMQGKALFDRDIFTQLLGCKNNNELSEVLTGLKEHVIPHYDDISGIAHDLLQALTEAFKVSRGRAAEPIQTPFGNLPGASASDITTLIADILSDVRFVDVLATFKTLLYFYKSEKDVDQRQHIVSVLSRLCKYNLKVWREVGPGVQIALTNAIGEMEVEERSACRGALLTVWRELLSPEISGIDTTAEGFIISSAGVSSSEHIEKVREHAIQGIFDALDQSPSDDGKWAATNCLWEATRLPNQASYSNNLVGVVLKNTHHIMSQLTERISMLPHLLLEHVEHEALSLYRRWREIEAGQHSELDSRELAAAACASILSFRDAANGDERFVRFKTLIGFNCVFEFDWDTDFPDFQKTELYRRKRAEKFVSEIEEETAGEWFPFIAACAAIKSTDMAMFPTFGVFLQIFAERKPIIAAQLFNSGNADLQQFLPAFLNGLLQSGAHDSYRAMLEHLLTDSSNFAAIARHWHTMKPHYPGFIERLLQKAITDGNQRAVVECVILTVSTQGSPIQPPIDTFLLPAIRFLTSKNNSSWIRGVWFLPELRDFCLQLSIEGVDQVLENIVPVERVDHEFERFLCQIAESHADKIWNYFRQRVNYEKSRDLETAERYQSIPYRLNELNKQLSLDPDLGVSLVAEWYRADSEMFEFRGAQLLSAAFPKCPQRFAQALVKFVEEAQDDELGFVISILRKYEGEPTTHSVVKSIIRRVDPDDGRLRAVEIGLENTGVVSGQFGFVEEFRKKRAEIAPWFADEDSKVKAFAVQFLAKLDRRIATEQRRAETQFELNRRDYDTDAQDT